MSDKAIRILLIEDDPSDARFIRQALADATLADPAAPLFALTCARRLASGLKRLAPGRFDVLLLDLSLPDSRGLDAFIKAHARAPQTPIVVLSGPEDKGLAFEAMQKGAQDYLIKGEVSGSLLVRALRYAIERKRAEEETRILAELLDASPAAITVHDYDGNFIYANQRTLDLHGYTREELMALNLHQLDVPESSRLIAPRMQELVERGEAAFEVAHYRKDGAQIPLYVSAKAARWGDRDIILSIATDITEHKRAEEALRASETRYRRLFESAQDGVLILDADTGEITDVNPFLIALLGYPREELLGKRLWDIGLLKDVAVSKVAFEELQRTGYIRYEDLPLETRDGRRMEVEFISNVYEVDHQRVIQCNIRDITARKRAEEALRRSETLLNESQAIAHIGSWELDVVANRLTWSDEVYRIFGLQPQGFGATYEAFLDTVHPDDRAAVDAAYSGSLREGRDTYEIEHRIIRRDNGDVRIVYEKCKHVKDASGRIVRSVGMVQDITERKRAEEALQESEEKYRQLFDLESDALVLIDNETGRILEANPAASTLYGYSREELLTKKNTDLSAEQEDTQRVTRTTPPTPDQVVTIPLRFHRKKDGTIFPVEITGRFFVRQGRPVHIAAIRDITERKRAEEALRESEEKFRMLAEQSPNMIFINQRGRVVYANARCEEIMGYTREEFYSPDFDFVAITAPEYVDLVKAKFAQHMRGEEVEPYEYALITKGGERIEAIIAPRLIDYGGERAILGVITDITERKRAEATLQESEEKYRNLVERANEGIAIIQDSIVQYANPYLVALWGGSIEDVIGTRFSDYVDPEELPQVAEHYRRRLAGESAPPIYETVLRRRSGEKVYVELNAGLIQYRGKSADLVIIRDITERKRTEEALRESEARYRAVIESQVDLISRYLPDTTLTFVNDAYCKFYGKTREELIGQSFLIMIAPEFRELVRKETEDLAKNPRPLVGEYLNYRHDGKERWIQWVVQCISDERGQVVELQAVGRDITARKQAEDALKRERDLVRRIMETSPAGIVMVNREGQITFANTSAERVLGLTRAEMSGRTYNDPRWRITDYDGNPFPDDELPFRRVMATGQPVFDVRHAVEWPDGRRVLLSINAAPLFDEQGRVDGMVATVDDITDRIRAEQALREESSFRNTIIKNAAEGLCVCHAVPEYPYVAFTVWNDRMTEITGYTMEEINRLGWYQTMYPDPEVQQRAVERMARMRVGEDLVAEEWTITRADGEKRTLLISTSVLETGDREVHVLAVMQDITERKKAEEEREQLLVQIQEQAHRMQEIMDTVPEGVLVLDSGERVILANPLGQRDLATLANVQVGDTLTRLGDRPLTELLTSPPKGLWHEVSAGSRFFQALARPIEDGPTPQGWVLVIRDMTQQREAERRAQQQERLAAVGQLAAGIAHDFNNIMAVITLYAGMLARTPDLPARVYERLETIHQQARRASDLIQQILDFSRRAVLERGPMDMLVFLKEQVKMLERTLPENIQINLVYGRDEYVVNGDPTRLQQAMMNLAANARDAMPEGGRLRIDVERVRVEDARQSPLPDMPAGEWVRVAVTDTGVGIPPDVLPHIFEPFFTTKAAGEGTGLGLAQVYGIVRQHEGYIDVKTEVGSGTTFTIYLPALAVPRPEPSPLGTEQLPQGHGETILVVEDNVAARQAVVSSLEMLGYRALQAANGQEALAIFEQRAGTIALVLSDVVMPEMGGRALLHALKERDPAVRVVLLTGHPLEEKEFEGLRALGLRGWVLKPLSVEQLAHVMARALEEDPS